MSEADGQLLLSYARLVGAALLVVAVVACLGYWPTIRIAGVETVWSMLVGCGVSWIAGCVGAIPLARAMSRRSPQPAFAVLASTALRFVTVLLLIVPLALSGWFEPTPLVLWVAVSYVVLLMLDTAFTVRAVKRTGENDS